MRGLRKDKTACQYATRKPVSWKQKNKTKELMKGCPRQPWKYPPFCLCFQNLTVSKHLTTLGKYLFGLQSRIIWFNGVHLTIWSLWPFNSWPLCCSFEKTCQLTYRFGTHGWSSDIHNWSRADQWLRLKVDFWILPPSGHPSLCLLLGVPNLYGCGGAKVLF